MITEANRAAFFNNFIPWRLDFKTRDEGYEGGGRTYFDSLKTFRPFLLNRNARARSKPGVYIQKKVNLAKEWYEYFKNKYSVSLKHYYMQTLDDRIYKEQITEKGWCLGISSVWIRHKELGQELFPDEVYKNNASCVTVARKIMDFQNKVNKHSHLLPDHVKRAKGAKPALDYIYSMPGVSKRLYWPITFRNPMTNFKQIPSMINKFQRIPSPRMLVGIWWKSGGAHAIAIDRSTCELFDPVLGVFQVDSGNSLDLTKFMVNILLNKYYFDKKNVPRKALQNEPFHGHIDHFKVFQVLSSRVKTT